MIENPVLRKELIYRMRPRRGNDTILGVMIVGVILVGLIYWMFLKWMITDPSGATGEDAWKVLTSIQFILICLAAPSIAANAISLEKEQQTWEMLIFTCLTPYEIIFGKLIARLTGLLGLLLLLAPISVFAWFRNSISTESIPISQVACSFILLTVTSIFFTTFGLFVSWLFRRTLYAVMASYTFVVGFLCIATMMITGGIAMLNQNSNLYESFPLMWLNPVYLLSIVLSASNSNPNRNLQYFLGGIVIYIILTIFMLVFMIAKFRRFSYAR